MKKPRSVEEIEKLKGRILEAALDIIMNEGFSALKMRSLAKKTRMTAPNIYNYFSGKDEIYLALVTQGFFELKKRLVKAEESCTEPKAAVKALLKAYLDFGMENPAHYEIMFTRRTPKYNDYKGTPNEKFSQAEYELSMEIAALSIETAAGAVGMTVDDKEILQMVIEAWCLLHGMVSLYNSGVAAYVSDDLEGLYSLIIKKRVEELGM